MQTSSIHLILFTFIPLLNLKMSSAGKFQAFQNAQESLGNPHYYFAGLVLPLVALAGIVENALVLFVLLRLTGVLGASTRFYCLAIAASQIGSLLFTHLANNFLENGVEFLLRGDQISFAALSRWTCKGLRAMNSFFPHLLNWTYFLLNLERLVSVLSPFRRRAFFSLRLAQLYWTFVLIAGLGVSTFAAFGYQVEFSRTRNNTACTIDAGIGMAFRHTLTADVFVGPNLLSFLFAVLLLFCVCRLAHRRERLFKNSRSSQKARSNPIVTSAIKQSDGGTSTRSEKVTSAGGSRRSLASATPRRCTSAAQVSSALTAVCLALVNVMFNLPGGVLGTLYYVQSQNLDPVSAGYFWVAYLLVRSFGSVGSLCDLVIYVWRIPAFRKEFCSLFCRMKESPDLEYNSIDDRTQGVPTTVGPELTAGAASNSDRIPLS